MQARRLIKKGKEKVNKVGAVEHIGSIVLYRLSS